MKVSLIIDVFSLVAPASPQVFIILSFFCPQIACFGKCIEDMKIPLIDGHLRHSTLLKKVAFNGCSSDVISFPEEYLHVFPKSTGVLISHSLAIAKGLQYGVAGQDFLGDGAVAVEVEEGEHLHAVFGRLCLPCAGFAGD